MKENDIINILKSQSVIEFVRGMHKFYPNGFDKEKIDIRLKEKINTIRRKF